MLSSLRVAAVQLNSHTDVEANLAACAEALASAAERGAQLALLPENFAYMGPEAGRRAVAEPLGRGPVQERLSASAQRHGLTIIAGGFPEQSSQPERPFNTCLVIDSSGDVAASYRKIHLFDVDLPDGTSLRESRGATAGDRPVVIEVAGFKVGLSICYDLRFPELYRALTAQGAEVLVVPAAFTLQTGKDHWHVLLRARAIEAQAWVVAAAQWGKHPEGRATYGHSLIVDPWGTVVAECSDRTGIVLADLDRGYLEQVRQRLPCLQHRRL